MFERLMAAHSEEITLEWKQTLVNILFALEKFRKALQWLEELAAETKGDTRRQWQEMLLYQYQSLEMKKKALAYARYLTRTHPEDPGWWKALAWAKKGLAKKDDSELVRIRDYVLATRKVPD